MKKCLMISALAVSVCLLGGCDFFRQLAGRPTSQDIAAKRERIEREAEAHQRRLDSLKAVQKQISDSLATLDSLRKTWMPSAPPNSSPHARTTSLNTVIM